MHSFFFAHRRILDDLAGDGPVKMESYDTGSSGASSPGVDENGMSQNDKQYQSIQLNGVVGQGGNGNSVVHLPDGQVGFTPLFIMRFMNVAHLFEQLFIIIIVCLL